MLGQASVRSSSLTRAVARARQPNFNTGTYEQSTRSCPTGDRGQSGRVCAGGASQPCLALWPAVNPLLNPLLYPTLNPRLNPELNPDLKPALKPALK